MNSAAVAALISLFSLFTAIWGLRLRLQAASRGWKQEATMLRRRSMAMTAAGVPTDGRGNRLSTTGEIVPISDDEKKRWSSISDMDKSASYLAGLGLAETQKPAYAMGPQQTYETHQRQQQLHVQADAEETLDDRLALARRNSMDHAAAKRAS